MSVLFFFFFSHFSSFFAAFPLFFYFGLDMVCGLWLLVPFATNMCWEYLSFLIFLFCFPN